MNKLILGHSSKLLQRLFSSSCDCITFTGINFDILCPDFDPLAMANVLELIFSGKTSIDPDNLELSAEIRIILRALQINIFLPDSDRYLGIRVL